MSVQVKQKTQSLLLCITALLAISSTGCSSIQAGASHRVVIDGPMDAAYEQDLSQCQEIATQRDYINGETKVDAIIGGVVGALAGVGDGAGNAVGGALLGAAVGGGAGALDTRAERKNIVINCMASRGYKVMESLGQHN